MLTKSQRETIRIEMDQETTYFGYENTADLLDTCDELEQQIEKMDIYAKDQHKAGWRHTMLTKSQRETLLNSWILPEWVKGLSSEAVQREVLPALREMASTCDELEQQLAQAQAAATAYARRVAALEKIAKNICEIMDNSNGVDGWYLDGNKVEWDEFAELCEGKQALEALEDSHDPE